jgi:hypothetical protein
MSRLDDRLTRELERAARPANPSAVFERVDRKRARRAVVRRLQAGGLVVVVLAGTIGGFALLSRAFREPTTVIGGEPRVRNGSIVYSQVRNAGQPLWVVQPDGTGARQLTTGDGSSDSAPSISPDGRTVAFDRTNQNGTAIYTIGIDGTGLTRLTDTPGADPAWSPDGSQIAFVGQEAGLYVMSVEDGNAHLVVDRSFVALHPTWSPDGTRIAFAAPSEAVGSFRNYDIWIADIAGGAPTNITHTTSASELAPAWSPDGSRILFSRSTPSGSILMTIAPDPAASPTAITDGSVADQNPAWSPDGQFIVFERDAAGATDLYTMRADGSNLTALATYAVTPVWQPLPINSSGQPQETTSPAASNRVVSIPGPTTILGVSRPACNVTEVTADFWGGSPTTVFVYQLEPDVGGCSNAVSGSSMVGIAPDGSTVTATYGPLACQPESCHIFGAPDIDGDGRAELAVVESSYGSSDLVQVYTVVANEQPTLVMWRAGGGRLAFDWDPNVGNPAGAFCQRRGPYDLALWSARELADGTYDLVEVTFRFDGSDGQLVASRDDKHVDPSKIAPGGGDQLCGVPVLP